MFYIKCPESLPAESERRGSHLSGEEWQLTRRCLELRITDNRKHVVSTSAVSRNKAVAILMILLTKHESVRSVAFEVEEISIKGLYTWMCFIHWGFSGIETGNNAVLLEGRLWLGYEGVH